MYVLDAVFCDALIIAMLCVFQILLVLISWLSQLLLGTFPLIFSKLILAFSVWVVLDPYIILIVDASLGRFVQSATNPIGDASKLYWHFLDVEGSQLSFADKSFQLIQLYVFFRIWHCGNSHHYIFVFGGNIHSSSGAVSIFFEAAQ